MTMARPWYENYDLGVLAEMVKRDPSYAALLPQAVWDQFPNEVYVASPQLARYASPGRLDVLYRDRPDVAQAVGVNPEMTAGALQKRGWTIDPRTGALMSPGAAAPPVAAAPAPSTGAATGGTIWKPTILPFSQKPLGPSVAAGDKVGFLERGGATGVNLVEPSQTTALPPGVAAPITGKPMPPYRTQGNVPLFSNQAIARMTPGERTVLGTTVNRAGGRAEDYWKQGEELTGGARGRRIGYGGVPRYAR